MSFVEVEMPKPIKDLSKVKLPYVTFKSKKKMNKQKEKEINPIKFYGENSIIGKSLSEIAIEEYENFVLEEKK
uniref:Uncharacterized protein n=1 Tax=viral metagenome TaxID=1070528 RepID=A0A6M3XWX2_9ZZZZ